METLGGIRNRCSGPDSSLNNNNGSSGWSRRNDMRKQGTNIRRSNSQQPDNDYGAVVGDTCIL